MTDPRVGQILDIVSRETTIDRAKLTPEATLDELGVASLDLIETIFKIEDAFDIEIPNDASLSGDKPISVRGLVEQVLAVLDGSPGGGEPAAPAGDGPKPPP